MKKKNGVLNDLAKSRCSPFENGGKLQVPWVNASMMADLTACGGIITMATGFRVTKIKSFPLIDLMPALILVMPFSAVWTALIG